MSSENEKKEHDDLSNFFANGLIGLLFICIGLCMLFVEEITLQYFVYVCGCIFLFIGVYNIGNYFISEKYKTLFNNDFAIGAIELILGTLMFIKANSIVKSLGVYLGVLILVEAILVLQDAIQVKALRGKASWFCFLCCILLGVFGGFLLFKNGKVPENLVTPYYWCIFAAGIIALISFLLVLIRLTRYNKEQRLADEQNAQVGLELGQDVDADDTDINSEGDSSLNNDYNDVSSQEATSSNTDFNQESDSNEIDDIDKNPDSLSFFKRSKK